MLILKIFGYITKISTCFSGIKYFGVHWRTSNFSCKVAVKSSPGSVKNLIEYYSKRSYSWIFNIQYSLFRLIPKSEINILISSKMKELIRWQNKVKFFCQRYPGLSVFVTSIAGFTSVFYLMYFFRLQIF